MSYKNSSKEFRRLQKLLFSDIDEATSGIIALAEIGDPMAMLLRADSYQLGIGAQKNLDTARLWYKRVEDAGLMHGTHGLGMNCFVRGMFDDAILYFCKVALKGFGPSCNMLGYMYEGGHGVSRNIGEARKYLELGSVNGHFYCRARLANILIRERFGSWQRIKGILIRILNIVLAIFLYKFDKFGDRLRT